MTIYANGGHAYMVVAGLRFDTSGAKSRSGTPLDGRGCAPTRASSSATQSACSAGYHRAA